MDRDMDTDNQTNRQTVRETRYSRWESRSVWRMAS